VIAPSLIDVAEPKFARPRRLAFYSAGVSQARQKRIEDTMNLRKTALAIGSVLMLATAATLRAQTGCDDSPEDPTLVLALVAGAGAIAAGVWRSRRRTP
jgi:XrtJ-associated TM-motif-TM protein